MSANREHHGGAIVDINRLVGWKLTALLSAALLIYWLCEAMMCVASQITGVISISVQVQYSIPISRWTVLSYVLLCALREDNRQDFCFLPADLFQACLILNHDGHYYQQSRLSHYVLFGTDCFLMTIFCNGVVVEGVEVSWLIWALGRV